MEEFVGIVAVTVVLIAIGLKYLASQRSNASTMHEDDYSEEDDIYGND